MRRPRLLKAVREDAVDVTFPVDPGRQYKLTAIDCSGNNSFSVELCGS